MQQPYHCSSKVLSYADDLVLISTIPSQDSLERDLEIIEDQCEYLGLKSNTPYYLELQGRPLEWVTEYKYLGITIDTKSTSTLALPSNTKQVNMRMDMEVLKSCIIARLNVMRRLTSSNSEVKVLKAYYTGAIRSLIEYSTPATMLMSNAAVRQLDILQNRARRITTRSYKWVSGPALNYITNTEPLHVRRQKSVLKVIDKTLRDLTHPNHEALYALINGFASPKNSNSWNAAALNIWQGPPGSRCPTHSSYNVGHLGSLTG